MITIRETGNVMAPTERNIAAVGDNDFVTRVFALPVSYFGMDLTDPDFAFVLQVEPVGLPAYLNPLEKTIVSNRVHLTWRIKRHDTARPGNINVNILISHATQDLIKQTDTEWFTILPGINAIDQMPEQPPDIMQQYVTQAATSAASAKDSADRAEDYYNSMLELEPGGGGGGGTGTQGPKGDKGDPGPKGDKGDTGATGPQGAQGPQGPAGAQGLQGPPGADGKDGKDGTGVNILGSYDSLGELQTAHPTGNIGDAYLVNGDLYVWAASGAWTNVGRIQGPQGLPGADGADGADGEDGAKGDKGDKGDTGGPGVQGLPGEQGPKGNDGAQGPKGDAGGQGPQGDVGPQGVQGVKGDTGPQGPAGYTPQRGTDYWTPADIEFMVQETLSRVVDGNGVAF